MYLLQDGEADDDVALGDLPGHRGRVGTQVRDGHVDRSGRSVWRRAGTERRSGSLISLGV